jgi:hypothetical protein
MGEKVPVDDIGVADDQITVEVGDGLTWVEVTDFETSPQNAVARGQSVTAIVFPRTSVFGYRKMRVTTRWGAPRIPSAVEQASLLQATRLYRRKDSPEGVAGSADWGLIRVPNLDPDVKALLRDYHTEALMA